MGGKAKKFVGPKLSNNLRYKCRYELKLNKPRAFATSEEQLEHEKNFKHKNRKDQEYVQCKNSNLHIIKKTEFEKHIMICKFRPNEEELKID